MNDKLNDAMNHIGDVHLYESIRPRRRRIHWIIFVMVALLALALFLYPIIMDSMIQQEETQPTSAAVEYTFSTAQNPDYGVCGEFSMDV